MLRTSSNSRRPSAESSGIFRVKVIDDKSELPQAMQKWIEKTGPIVPSFDYLTRAARVDDIDDFVRAADAIFLDHKIEGRFAGFQNGLEIGKYIARMLPDNTPIKYYSAFNNLIDGATDASKAEVQEFTSRKNVTVYRKADLTPDRKLPDLNADLQKHFAHQLKEMKTMIIEKLSAAEVVGRERKLFRIENFDGRRKYQEVRNLEDPYAPTVELSTNALKSLRLDRAVKDVVLEVCEFSSGHVISSFATTPRVVSKEVLKLLRERHERDDD